jgi:hypothetical protein
MTYRLEITLSESTYRGDRDERLTVFTVSGEGSTETEAIANAVGQMLKLDYDPGSIHADATVAVTDGFAQ